MLEYLKNHPHTWYKSRELAEAIPAPYRSVLGILRSLRTENRVAHTGKKRSQRWKWVAQVNQ